MQAATGDPLGADHPSRVTYAPPPPRMLGDAALGAASYRRSEESAMTTSTMHHRSGSSEGAVGGLVTFAGVMLFIAGILDLFRGIMAIANDDVYVNTPNY